jgi:hypothetical protein
LILSDSSEILDAISFNNAQPLSLYCQQLLSVLLLFHQRNTSLPMSRQSNGRSSDK